MSNGSGLMGRQGQNKHTRDCHGCSTMQAIKPLSGRITSNATDVQGSTSNGARGIAERRRWWEVLCLLAQEGGQSRFFA